MSNREPSARIDAKPRVSGSAFFSIHSVNALENKAFSIVHANIENTPEKVELARSLYPIENWHFEFHDYKINMRVVF